MSKPLLQLAHESRADLAAVPEAGMGYFVVKGRLNTAVSDRTLVIAGDYFVVPEEHGEFLSLSDLHSGSPLPSKATATCTVKVTGVPSPPSPAKSFLPGYLPSVGALPLIAAVTLPVPTVFFRFTRMDPDPKFNGSTLLRNTYLTTALDRGYANTGFAAVGRYALPIPFPASNVFVYQLSAGATLLVGTVLPNYGQAGGGVEVQLPADTSAALIKRLWLDDF